MRTEFKRDKRQHQIIKQNYFRHLAFPKGEIYQLDIKSQNKNVVLFLKEIIVRNQQCKNNSNNSH